jgi:hypothetical protein
VSRALPPLDRRASARRMTGGCVRGSVDEHSSPKKEAVGRMSGLVLLNMIGDAPWDLVVTSKPVAASVPLRAYEVLEIRLSGCLIVP